MAIKFRGGDIVSVQGTVRHNVDPEDTTVAVNIAGHHDAIWPDLVSVKMVQQRIVIGDIVAFDVTSTSGNTNTFAGQVLAISNDHAWVDLGGGDYCTRTLSSIKRNEA